MLKTEDEKSTGDSFHVGSREGARSRYSNATYGEISKNANYRYSRRKILSLRCIQGLFAAFKCRYYTPASSCFLFCYIFIINYFSFYFLISFSSFILYLFPLPRQSRSRHFYYSGDELKPTAYVRPIDLKTSGKLCFWL